MKSSIFAITLVTASLVGCAKSSSDDSKPAPNDPKAMKVVTDTSVCGRGPAAHSLDGVWASNQLSVDGNLSLQARFTFQGQRLTLSNTCAMGGRSLVASVTVPVSISGDQIRVLSEGHDSERIDEENFKLECHAAAAAGSMPYQFSGSCLKFVDPKSNQELILVPMSDSVPSPAPQPGPQPVPQPQPAPQPAPQPVPQPQPFPFPQPQPEPHSADSWACLERNTLTNQVFIGFGPTTEIAKSSAKQVCRGGESSQFCDDQAIDCSRQEGYRDSWFCELNNSLTNTVYNGRGLSRIEATYAAEKACADSQSNQFCESGTQVKCSRF